MTGCYIFTAGCNRRDFRHKGLEGPTKDGCVSELYLPELGYVNECYATLLLTTLLMGGLMSPVDLKPKRGLRVKGHWHFVSVCLRKWQRTLGRSDAE